MSGVAQRNVRVGAEDPVQRWPSEAILTAIDRGTLTDWRRLAAEIRRSPWGEVARTVVQVTTWRENPGVDEVLGAIVARARRDVEDIGRQSWAEHVRTLRASTGLSMRAFARLAGTSASRLSDYEHGKTAPTTDTLARLTHAASVARTVARPVPDPRT